MSRSEAFDTEELLKRAQETIARSREILEDFRLLHISFERKRQEFLTHSQTLPWTQRSRRSQQKEAPIPKEPGSRRFDVPLLQKENRLTVGRNTCVISK